jgi:hypothetical protein
MTPSPPEEAILFRGKSLSPASPLPLHYPEPSKIPVLQNQMDPVFNDTATYQTQSIPVEKPSIFNFDTHTSSPSESARQTSEPKTLENGLDNGATVDSIHSNVQQGKGSYPMSLDVREQTPDNQPSSSAPLAQVGSNIFDTAQPSDEKPPSTGSGLHPSDSVHSLDDTPHVSSNAHPNTTNLLEYPSNTEQPTTTLNEALSGAIDLLQDQTNADVSHAKENGDQSSQDPDDAKPQPHSGNLSPSTATAPSAGGITAATTTSPRDEPSLPEASNENLLPTPAGLPPRPPPQEKPSMHPNYAASSDIRTYHQLPPQNSNIPSSYASQTSNTYRSGPGLPPHMPSQGAPGTASSSNSLPPPPLATFQQPLTQHHLSQQSGSTQGYLQGDGSKSPGPRSATSERGDDEAPWGPEIQKKYDEFLREERVYVTEGLWDRFPPGSRLFIGKQNDAINSSTHAYDPRKSPH